MHRVVPEWLDRLELDIRPTHADVFQRFITQARQQFALLVQFVPATELVQQIGYQVDRVFFYRWIFMLTFHLVALRFGWLQSRAGTKINPTNVSDVTYLGD